MCIDPRISDEPRTCDVCEERDVHRILSRHCGPCHMDWASEWMTDDEALADLAADLDEPVVEIEIVADDEVPRTSSGEFTLNISDYATVNAEGEVA